MTQSFSAALSRRLATKSREKELQCCFLCHSYWGSFLRPSASHRWITPLIKLLICTCSSLERGWPLHRLQRVPFSTLWFCLPEYIIPPIPVASPWTYLLLIITFPLLTVVWSRSSGVLRPGPEGAAATTKAIGQHISIHSSYIFSSCVIVYSRNINLAAFILLWLKMSESSILPTIFNAELAWIASSISTKQDNLVPLEILTELDVSNQTFIQYIPFCTLNGGSLMYLTNV